MKQDSNHNGFLNELRQIEALEFAAEQRKIALLRASGWEYSSKYADCYWRWSKTVNDRPITTTDIDEALRVEERISPCDENCTHDD